jgi:hypothetical protein
MNCCIKCFVDSQICEIIDSSAEVENCDFCGSKDVKIYAFSDDDRIEELLESVIDIYRVSECPDDGKSLKDALLNDWNIFAVPADVVQALITAICSGQLAKNEKIFLEPVYIPELHDDDYLKEYGITSGHTWSQFSETIKYGNRFHSSIFNHDAFASFLSFAVKTYPAGTIMHRARISDKDGLPKDKLGAPPKEKRTAGRINPEGVGVLYLSSVATTAIYEVRASIYDFVTVGEFRLQQDIKVINLAGINSISPFIYADTNDLQPYAVNRMCLQEIAADIAKPLRTNDSPLEYLPTQFISEYIKSQGYNGVEYSSTMTKDGYNLAVFDESLFECVGTRVYEIAALSYQPREIDPRTR